MRCGDCKHFTKRNLSCDAITDYLDVPEDAIVSVRDSEGYGAWIEVTEDFGCVLFDSVQRAEI